MSEQQTKDEQLSEHCERSAKFYAEAPGLFGVRAGIDLYHVCAALAYRIEKLERQEAATPSSDTP